MRFGDRSLGDSVTLRDIPRVRDRLCGRRDRRHLARYIAILQPAAESLYLGIQCASQGGTGSRDRGTRGVGRGLEVSLCGLRKDQLVQRQIRYHTTKPGVLSLQLFQALDLIALQTTVLIAPPIIGYFRHAYRSDCVCYLRPCAISTLTCRSFATISSAVCLFLAIDLILHPKTILQGGPLQRAQVKGRRISLFELLHLHAGGGQRHIQSPSGCLE